MNITIILDSSRLELLGSSGAGIIEKLYLLAIDFNNTLTLKGNISSINAYGYLVDYLNTNYGPDFIVNATNRYIHFEDPNMESYLASMSIGDNGKTTEALAAAVTTIANAPNSTITKFNELRYFTSITESKNGWDGHASGDVRFYQWTALEEVDISNFTSIGHVGGAAWEDTFSGCTSLKKVTASSKLKKIGYNAFYNCSNLELIIGLSGELTLSSYAFLNCAKLTSDAFENCTSILTVAGYNNSVFLNCTSLTSLPPIYGTIGSWFCSGCTNLETVDISNVTEIFQGAFLNCTKLTNVTLSPNLSTMRYQAFAGCRSLTSIVIPSGITSLEEQTFITCPSLTSVYLPSNLTYFGRYALGDTPLREVTIGNLNNYICAENNKLSGMPKGTASRQIDLYVGDETSRTKVTDVVFPTQLFVDAKVNNGASTFNFEGYSIESIRFPWITGCADLPGLPICCNCKSLKKIYVDEGYTQVGYHAFEGSGPLLEVWLPSTFTGFGNDAFKNCTYNNNKVIFLNTTTPTFTNTVPTGIYYCPDSVVSDYRALSWIGNNARGLSQLANISDDYKDMLVTRGCTATGSTGNWTIKAPGEA